MKMKLAFLAPVFVLGVSGCATTGGPDPYAETFVESVARNFAEMLFDAIFGNAGTTKVSHDEKRWLGSVPPPPPVTKSPPLPKAPRRLPSA